MDATKVNLRAALDALFAKGNENLAAEREAKRVKAEADKIAATRKRLGSAKTTGLESFAELNALAARLEAELQWRDIALRTVFRQQTCTGCGSVATILEGKMVEQQHKTDRTAKRYLRVNESVPDGLPERSEVWAEHVDVCFSCFVEHTPQQFAIVPLPLPVRKDTNESLVA